MLFWFSRCGWVIEVYATKNAVVKRKYSDFLKLHLLDDDRPLLFRTSGTCNANKTASIPEGRPGSLDRRGASRGCRNGPNEVCGAIASAYSARFLRSQVSHGSCRRNTTHLPFWSRGIHSDHTINIPFYFLPNPSLWFVFHRLFLSGKASVSEVSVMASCGDFSAICGESL